MPDPTLIVALRKKRLNRYGDGGGDSGDDGSDGDKHMDITELMDKFHTLEDRVSKLESKLGGGRDDYKDGEGDE